ncbi:MAG: hypothetical protein WD557_05440 [Dehalococcoidia bacterium]
MVTFWNWFVRNPAFFAAAVAFAAGGLSIVEWSLALPAGVAGVVIGDAGWHLSRRATVRKARRSAQAVATTSTAEAIRRFTDYNRVESDVA